MMTTAGDLKLADGTRNTDVFATGAGQVDPARVLDPGLVYDAGYDDYPAFIQGTGMDLGMPGIGTTKPRDMNVPSFALGNLAGKIEVTRTVTALTPGIYRATADVPGVKVSVTPAVLNFSAAGEKRTFKVSFENQDAPLGQFATGSLTWQGAGKKVASPIAVRPQSIVAASDVAFTSEGGDRLRRHQGRLRHQRARQHDPRRPLQGGLHRRGTGPGPVRRRHGCLEPRQDGPGSGRQPRWRSSRCFPRTRTPTSTCT